MPVKEYYKYEMNMNKMGFGWSLHNASFLLDTYQET